MLSFKLLDRALVEFSNSLKRSIRFGTKSPKVDTVLSLENGWSASAKIRQTREAHVGLLERFLQPLVMFLLDDLDPCCEDLFLALSHGQCSSNGSGDDM